MNILPKKSWHVRNKDNIARVRRDEARAAEEEREVQRRVERAEQEARTQYLRQKARASLRGEGGLEARGAVEEHRSAHAHLNLFPVEEASQRKGNEEYLKEKKEEKERQERAIGLLVSLGPAPGTESTPWYLKDGASRGGKDDDRDKKGKDKSRIYPEDEKQKKDKRLKDSLDPLKEIKKALAIKDSKEKKKSKKKEKMEREEKKSTPSSIEKLRAERLQREAEERKKAQAVLEQRSGANREKEQYSDVQERDRPYNSAYFPELARKRQRRERDYYGL
ncbi:leukocyte receptor cluster member 1-like [Scleropages formosus]|uniref:Leukocyte receptor cluster (LRC) member 1 n=1 Tax=Scleropages formosus TaxID=113540 RepID=A0A0N8K2R1_SCLFO|nr:leukocyte receptor cluster member 1 [Scleropages formosus]KPP78441.1 leukocyte receptor cluster member 1-like [Scleropages formosus]